MMIYTKEQIQGHIYDRHPLQISAVTLCEDWLEHDGEIKRLRDAAAAVVKAWTPEAGWTHESHLAVNEAIDNLRIAAGLPDPDKEGGE